MRNDLRLSSGSRVPAVQALTAATFTLALLLGACGGGRSPGEDTAARPGGSPESPSSAARAADGPASGPATAASAAAGQGASAGGEEGPVATGPTAVGRELVNPDASTMVFLYYSLAHLPLPLDNWVEDDSRVKFAPPSGSATPVHRLKSGEVSVTSRPSGS